MSTKVAVFVGSLAGQPPHLLVLAFLVDARKHVKLLLQTLSQMVVVVLEQLCVAPRNRLRHKCSHLVRRK